ncbi:MAG: DUF2339 domain-containing protein [Bacillota bacterium]
MDKEKLEELLSKQEDLENNYQLLADSYDAETLIEENEELKKQLRSYKREIDNLEDDIYNLQTRNKKLRSSLKEKIIDERMKLLKISRKKLELYFSARANDYKDRLTALEDEVKEKLDKLNKQVEAAMSNDKEELTADINNLSTKINQRLQYRREEVASRRQEIKSFYQQGETELINRKVEEKDIKKRQEQNNLEEKLGLEWLNKAGLIVVVLALIAVFRYAYLNYFNQYFKMGFIYLLGSISLGLAEFANQKREKIVQSLLVLGLATLYFASFNWGLISAVVITILALYLAIRYHSQIVFMIALTGGYSPLVIYILFTSNSNVGLTEFQLGLAIVYTMISFIIYSILIINVFSRSRLSFQKLFKRINKFFVVYNTIISFLVLYWLVMQWPGEFYLGLVPLFFVVLYLVFARKLKYTSAEMEKLFKILIFCCLVLIPVVQVSIFWWAGVWFIEGMLVIYYLFIRQNQIVSKFSKKGLMLNYFKYFSMFSLWIYAMYFAVNINEYFIFIWIFINFASGYILQELDLLVDRLVDYFSVFLYLFSDLLCLYVTLNNASLIIKEESFNFNLYSFLLILANLLLFLSLRQLIIIFLKKYKYNFEFYPLSLGCGTLIYVTTILIVQFNLAITDLKISVFYLILAVVYILYGLYRDFVYIRLAGLLLISVTIIKLFLVDLSFLDGIFQVISYLILGSSLLLISFVYQKIKSKIND